MCNASAGFLTIFYQPSDEFVLTQLDLPKLQQPGSIQVGAEKVEEDFTLARLYISKMKSEAKSLIQHCSQLETAQTESNKKLDEAESQLSQCKMLIQQVINCIVY
jgi:hypothetical protein